LIHDSAGCERGKEAILATAEGWTDARCAAFGAVIIDVVLDNVGKRTYVGVGELG